MLKKLIPLSLVITLVVVIAIINILSHRSDQININRILTKNQFRFKEPNESLDQYIRSQMKICLENAGRDYCYRDLADVLMRQFKLKEILQSFSKNETYPEIFSRCHEETHYLSRIEYQRVGNIAKVYDQCDSTCHGGCYHGAIEQYLKNKNVPLTSPDNEAVAKVITQICGKKQDYSTPLIYGECIHGIGHATMFVTDMELPKSLELCDLLFNQEERETCYSGVFMENSSSSTNNDHPGKFIKVDDPMYPCNILDKQYLSQCYRYQSSYFGFYTKWDWSKVASLCSKVPKDYRSECFQTIGTNQVGYTQDFNQMKRNCSLIKDETFRNFCIRGIVVALGGRYVNQPDRLNGFCQLVDAESKKTCYQQIGVSISSWYKNSEDVVRICNQIKTKDYASWCRDSLSRI